MTPLGECSTGCYVEANYTVMLFRMPDVLEENEEDWLYSPKLWVDLKGVEKL